MSAPADRASALAKFDAAANAAANEVISVYSTSFGLATRLLGRRHRQHVRNIYAMVRVADEIVDGVAAQAGLDAGEQGRQLDAYEAATHAAMRAGYSSDLVLHAFARTATAAGIAEELTAPFFASMRTDLDAQGGEGGPLCFDAAAHEAYVYGSAEVVGLMCLAVFVREDHVTGERRETLSRGARSLGAAFQNINFLRDLADDTTRLGRSYLAANGRLTPADHARWITSIRAQLAAADDAIPLLPRDARTAVRSAHALFSALTDRLERTAVDDLYRTRVRVPQPRKLALTAGAALRTAAELAR
ncbi:MAG: squalene/phytoene synthase family protein [Actinomycetota bacterium]|nr:squalene/phytoene synthase family protein [Actinomycetota bacterium]